MKLSAEHSGYIFEKEPIESIEKLKKHSGGVGSRAIRMTMESNSPQISKPSNQENEVRESYGSVNKPDGMGVAVDVNVYNEEVNLLGSRRSGDYCTWLQSFFR